METTLEIFDTLPSTNTEALERARDGGAEGVCIVARQQTAGRGRHGRVWRSEKDAGLNFSIILRPKIEMQFLPLITLMSGVAVHDTLRECGLDPDIKWVNDILVNEKKISGILAETAETDLGLGVVVGVGINLTAANYPPEMADLATSIDEEVPCQGISPDQAAETLAGFISYFYDKLLAHDGPATIVNEWRKRSTYFSGKAVKVVTESGTLTGMTDGLEANGALRVRTADATVAVIQTGDVERLRAETAR